MMTKAWMSRAVSGLKRSCFLTQAFCQRFRGADENRSNVRIADQQKKELAAERSVEREQKSDLYLAMVGETLKLSEGPGPITMLQKDFVSLVKNLGASKFTALYCIKKLRGDNAVFVNTEEARKTRLIFNVGRLRYILGSSSKDVGLTSEKTTYNDGIAARTY